MTIFVLSHNLQLESAVVPSISAEDLAQGLLNSSSLITEADALSHPHWLVRIESALSADAMANELVKAWKQYRLNQGHSTEHHWLALGGRKDTEGSPGSPLVAGSWGVDVVECSVFVLIASPGRRHGALRSVWNLSSTHLQVLLREQFYWTLLGSKRELPMRIRTYNSGHR